MEVQRHPPQAGVIFVADVHLDDSQPEITRRFEQFLRHTASRYRSLYLLGDIFESWVGDDDTSALSQRIQAPLKHLTDTGVRCYFMPGNRDFLLGEDWLQRARITLLADPSPLPAEDTPAGLAGKIWLSHGDALCTDDLAYQKIRRMLRDPRWQADFLAKPLAERKVFAQTARERSRQYVSAASDAIMDVNPQAVNAFMDRLGADMLIHGHTHRPAMHRWQVPDTGHWRQRLVLGDWHRHTAYLSLTDGEFRLNTC